MSSKYGFIVPSGKLLLALLLTSSILTGWTGAAVAAAGDIWLISADASGQVGNFYSRNPAISDDGRLIVYESDATNLVAGDTNGSSDIFLFDHQTGQTSRVSIAPDGSQANGSSFAADISGDGRYVAFASEASNLVLGDTNEVLDIFVQDLQTGQTSRVSTDSSGMQANGPSSEYTLSISGNGQVVAFSSEANNLVEDDMNGVSDVFIHNRLSGLTERISIGTDGTEANGSSSDPDLSGDGRLVVFSSHASNLVSGDTNGQKDVFVHDSLAHTTIRVSVSSSGQQATTSCTDPTISGDGQFVAFSSESDYLAGINDLYGYIYLYNMQTGQVSVASRYTDGYIMVGTPYYPDLASNGRYLTFQFDDRGDAQGLQEIVVRDLVSGITKFAPRGGSGSEDSSYRPSVSANGNIVAYWSISDRLVSGDTNNAGDVFVYEVPYSEPLPPTVTSIARADPNPTASQTIRFTINFSETVTGVDPGDFTLTLSGSLAGAAITNLGGSGDVYTLTADTGSGEGDLHLDLIDDDSILSASGLPLGGLGAGNGDFTTGQAYTIDKSIPVVTSSQPTDPNPTAASSVNFALTFSEPVSGVDPSDLTLTTSGSITGTAITGLSGSGSTYAVTVSTGSGEGDLRLDIIDDDSILDASGYSLGGASPGNGNYSSGGFYTIDKSIPIVTSSQPTDPNPTNADVVHFALTFSEPVAGLDASDLVLSTSGSIYGALITEVTGSGSAYSVSADTGSGDGSLRLDVFDNDSIVDASGYSLGGAGIGNGNFTSGSMYSINKKTLVRSSYLFRSNGENDGWVLESSETSNQGGSKDNLDNYLFVGDDNQNRQYRILLHFPTHYLPDDAIVVTAALMIKKAEVVGVDPFSTHHDVQVDISQGAFGFFGPFRIRGLQLLDFQAASSRDAVGFIRNDPIGDWYWTILDPAAHQFINTQSVTQLRLSFQLDDNDDFDADLIKFFSGNENRLSNRPILLIDYLVPKWGH